MKTACLQKAGATLVADVECAASVLERMRGLLGRTGLARGRAMHIAHCSSIHTFFMKFDLDLVFLSGDMKVCRIVRSVRRNRIVTGGLRARSVIEMETGWFPADALAVGDEVRLVAANPASSRGPDRRETP